MAKSLLVNGWFAQTGVRLNLNPENPEPGIYLANNEHHYHFAGMFVFDNEAETNFTGEMDDRCGHSLIRSGILLPKKLTFVKKYVNRADEIMYDFALPIGTTAWVGTYKGDRVGTGRARLLLTEVPPEFFPTINSK
jgi:hypothetical protein